VAQLIQPDGTVTRVAPHGAAQFTLPELHALIEATTIEIVKTKGRTLFLVIDEEGRGKRRPYNRAATALYGRGMIVGPALLCHRSEIR